MPSRLRIYRHKPQHVLSIVRYSRKPDAAAGRPAFGNTSPESGPFPGDRQKAGPPEGEKQIYFTVSSASWILLRSL